MKLSIKLITLLFTTLMLNGCNLDEQIEKLKMNSFVNFKAVEESILIDHPLNGPTEFVGRVKLQGWIVSEYSINNEIQYAMHVSDDLVYKMPKPYKQEIPYQHFYVKLMHDKESIILNNLQLEKLKEEFNIVQPAEFIATKVEVMYESLPYITIEKIVNLNKDSYINSDDFMHLKETIETEVIEENSSQLEEQENL
jgi:hypothetical protein